MQKANSTSRGKSSAFKLIGYVEDEEGEVALLATEKLESTPSILLTTNQVYGDKGKRKSPDWCCSCL